MIHWCAQVAQDEWAKALAEGRVAEAAWHLDWQTRIQADATCAVSYFFFTRAGDIVYPARRAGGRNEPGD